MQALDLPREVLQHIFHHLEERFPYYVMDGEEDLIKGSLLQVQSTCKQWYQVAREVFYEKVDLTGNSEKAALFLRTLESSSDIGQAVKKLHFSDESINDNIVFSSIVKLCPNLKALLQWEEAEADLYTPSLALYQEGYLQKLEKVSEPPMFFYIDEAEQHYQRYNQLMLAAKNTITRLRISEFNHYALAAHLDEFINLKELEIHTNGAITLQQFSNLLYVNHPLLESIDHTRIPATSQGPRPQAPSSLHHELKSQTQIKRVEMELRPVTLQDVQGIQLMFPNVNKLFVNTRAASRGPAVSNSVIAEANPDSVLDQFFDYLSAINRFYIGNVVLSSKELLAALTIVSKHFEVCHVSIELVESSSLGHHSFLIATAESFERITIPRGGDKPNCGIGLKVNRSLVNDAFCRELYRTLARKTAPLGMVIIGRLAPQNQYLGNHIGYLLVHCPSLIQLTMYDLSIDIGPLPDTDNVTSILNFNIIDSTITPNTLQEAARKLRLMDVVKIDNVQVMDVETETLSNITEIIMPEANIDTLIFYGRRPDHRNNVIFKIQLTSGTFYYHINSAGWVTKLSRNAYLSRQNSTETRVPEFTIHCDDLSRLITAAGILEIV